MQLSVRIPEHLIQSMDEHVDGVKYRSRAQLISVVCMEWLLRRKVEEKNAKSKKAPKKR